MKEFLIVILILLSSGKSKADCPLSSMEFWPAGTTIYENSLIVIDGYHLSNKIIVQLNHEYPIYLTSGNLKVELKIKEITYGEAGLTQAILLPVKELIPGNEYQLNIDNIPSIDMPFINHRNPDTEKYEFPIWKVIKGRDVQIPRWKIRPKEVKKTYVQYGCGPETYVYFNFQAVDQSEILIRTSVTSLSSNKTIVCYLRPDKNEVLKVGRGMCGGAFSFEDGEKFEVTFNIMDASGNISLLNGNKIEFTKPIDPN
ncbi:MAG: hypothetical protein IPP15_01315 [Saprospiraceae bacterium]|uniref:Uncharacterized protein n=1 Tax=Candidatus Opimibacter skivensis TaxID=2982028 RepID=A0A9D7SPV8_9BACT|nr:hypothetical protein [Candidatus Opimibacter skivensis]